MSARPTAEDQEALELLLDIDRVDEAGAQFLESLYERGGPWSERQCKWFDDLVARYL